MKEKKIQKIGRLPLLSKKTPTNLIPSQKKSHFKDQLIERQKYRKNFLLTKKQLRAFYDVKRKVTMEEATESLTHRFDILIYFLCASNGIFCTLREIRQKIRHGHFFVNGQREKRPNYLCRSTDTIRGGYPIFKNSSKYQQNSYAIHFQNLRNYFNKF